ncbi:MAG: hypothetical protein Q9227_001292 [Pyrenula ochraceoflavens]
MSRNGAGRLHGPNLPSSLQKELGLPAKSLSSSFGPGNGRTHRLTRKEARKAARGQKKTPKTFPKSLSNTKLSASVKNTHRRTSTEETVPLREKRHSPRLGLTPARSSAPLEHIPSSTATVQFDGEESSQSILSSSESKSRSTSPALRFDATSQAFRARAAKEDAEIVALEKKLGVKTHKYAHHNSSTFDGLLEDSDSESSRKRKREREEREWLQRKRMKTYSLGHDTLYASDSENLNPSHETLDLEFSTQDHETKPNSDESEQSADRLPSLKRKLTSQSHTKENPFVPPRAADIVRKYVPPSRREPSTADDQENHVRLQRQLQSSLNKISVSNLLSILFEIEKIYLHHPRKNVTLLLADLLIVLFTDRTSLHSTFAILHAAFVTGLYRIIGTDVGAEIIVRLVDSLDQSYHHTNISGSHSKQATNLICLLCHLYTFHLVSAVLIFDLLRVFLGSMNEKNTELILKIVRESGPQLRQDDPSSLRDIVLMLRNLSADSNSNGSKMNVRTKFMMDSIVDLKNNKHGAGDANSRVASEHVIRLRKALGSLSSYRTLKASEPLGLGLSDIRDRSTKGSWWLVGASWKESPRQKADAIVLCNPNDASNDAKDSEENSLDLTELAKSNRMNTSVRKSILAAIISAGDFKDACNRLQKLQLKRAQESEISRVIIHCVVNEDGYNPYYMLIVKSLCAEKKMRVAFQFGLWALFKRIGEYAEHGKTDPDENEMEEQLSADSIVNAATFFGHLIINGALSIDVLKVLNLPYLKEKGKMFVEVLFLAMLRHASTLSKSIILIGKCFGTCSAIPQFVAGLQNFLTNVVYHSDLIAGKEKQSVRRGCKHALKTLDSIDQKARDVD